MPRRWTKDEKAEKFAAFLDEVEPLLQTVGEITTGKVWEKVAGKWPYWYVSDNTHEVMSLMIEQGKAVRGPRQGLWIILKPNYKTPQNEIVKT